jgi:hypothetical protein
VNFAISESVVEKNHAVEQIVGNHHLFFIISALEDHTVAKSSPINQSTELPINYVNGVFLPINYVNGVFLELSLTIFLTFSIDSQG